MARRVVVIGAGIVGSALAREFAARPDVEVTVIEQHTLPLRGSTAFAPGFVGLHNDVPLLTQLARDSAAVYSALGVGFERTGGLELATSEEGAAQIRGRIEAAQASGLPVREVAGPELPDAVRAFVDIDRVVTAAHYLDDGSAEPIELMSALRDAAIEGGAVVEFGDPVVGIDDDSASVSVRTASGGHYTADAVVLAGGVWGSGLAREVDLDLPLYPVAHPYVYSGANQRYRRGAFVRWPEQHVYARVHGDRLGIGSYDHVPKPIDVVDPGDGAGLPWDEAFDSPIERAQALLRADARFDSERRVNGVFAMTPDNLPFLGRHPGRPNVWVAQAMWVTHAAGAAAALARAMVDDVSLPVELAPERFDGHDQADLRDAAMRLYRDIYAHEPRELS